MHNKVLLILIIIASIIIGASTLKGGHEWGDDFAWYILQAKSIVEGTTEEFIETSSFTNSQSTTHVGPLTYPWGYPLILTPFYAINGISPLTLKLPGLIFFAGFLICLYFLLKTRISATESLLLVSLHAFNPLLLNFLDQILSDIPFLFFSTLTLLLMLNPGRRTTPQQVLIGVSIFFTTFIRATGILLLGSYLIIELFKVIATRKDKEAIKKTIRGSILVCLVFALLWIVNALLFPSGGESYLSQYATLTFEIVRDFASAYFRVFSQFFGQGTSWMYIYYIAFIFFLVGVWAGRKEDTIFILFFALWMIVHITYPYWQGARYIFPLLPIFIYFTFQGINFVLSRFPVIEGPTRRKISYSFWVIIVFLFFLESSGSAYNNLKNHRKINGPFDDQSSQVYRFLQKNTSEDSIVVFFKPRAMRLMSDRNSIMSMECDRVLLGDYLVLSKLVGENQQIPPEKIDACQLPLKHVFENRKFIIYLIQNQ